MKYAQKVGDMIMAEESTWLYSSCDPHTMQVVRIINKGALGIVLNENGNNRYVKASFADGPGWIHSTFLKTIRP
jgi:hypothetical protein